MVKASTPERTKAAEMQLGNTLAVCKSVTGIEQMRSELERNGAKTGNWRIDERDGEKFQVFFVVAPDGLCFYFNEPIESSSAGP